MTHSEKSATIWESNHSSCVFKVHYCSMRIQLYQNTHVDYSDYPKNLVSRINEVYVCSIKYWNSDTLLNKHKLHLSHLFCCDHTCYCVNMVSVTSASHYHPHYQIRSSMYICGLMPRNLAEIGRGSLEWLWPSVNALYDDNKAWKFTQHAMSLVKNTVKGSPQPHHTHTPCHNDQRKRQ